MPTALAPEPLTRNFDVDALRAEPGVVVALDRDDRILWVNDAWVRFAAENGGAEVLARHGLGTRYVDGIQGPLADYFAGAFASVRGGGAPWEVEYECSSPDTFRLHRARVLPLSEGWLLVEHSAVETRPHARAAAPPLEVEYRDAGGVIVQCSNCRRVRRGDDGWWWVPAWVAAAPAAPVSHGLCAGCAGLYLEAARRARRARRGGAT